MTTCPAFRQYCQCPTDCQEPIGTTDLQDALSKLQTDIPPPVVSVRRQSSQPTRSPRTPSGLAARTSEDDGMRRDDPRVKYGFQPAGAPESDRQAMNRMLAEAAANTRSLQDDMELN